MSTLVTQDREAKARRRDVLERELARIVDVLKALGAQKIILFGSMAARDIGRGSDIDLIVVMKTEKRFVDRLTEVYDAAEPAVGLDVLVYTPEEFETLARERPFVRNAVKTGVMLYEA